MGILLSRFRKKKTTIEVLEDLDMKIKEIQRYGQTTEQRHKKIVGTLIIYSVVLYILAALVFYFYFFPASLRDRFFYITPLLIFPLLIILTKRMVTWYYNRKISRNQDKLSTMQKEKKKILDDVTETETYKKAKEILMKFAPDQLRMTPLSPQQVYKQAVTESPRRPSTPQADVAPLPGASELRRRAVTISNTSANVPTGRPVNSGLVPVGLAPVQTPLRQIPFQTGARSLNASTIGPRSPLPRPILPQQRSYLDRLVEYLVGDGPSNRYALICQVCDSHNGMALKEEFEYFGFRCCYCNFWNPARKQKPSAPKLEQDLSSPYSSSLQTPKISELNASTASSASSSSVKSMSEPLSNPISPCTEVQIHTNESSPEPSILWTIKSPEIAKSLEVKRRRRTIYQLKPYDPSDVYQDCISETIFSSPRQRPKAVFPKSPGDSDIEVVEKLSDNSDNEEEKESAAETQKSEDMSLSNVEGRRTVSGFVETTGTVLATPRQIKLREPILNVEKLAKTEEDSSVLLVEKNEEAQSEEMEVDESPKK